MVVKNAVDYVSRNAQYSDWIFVPINTPLWHELILHDKCVLKCIKKIHYMIFSGKSYLFFI
jgi:hypothetical protein